MTLRHALGPCSQIFAVQNNCSSPPDLGWSKCLRSCDLPRSLQDRGVGGESRGSENILTAEEKRGVGRSLQSYSRAEPLMACVAASQRHVPDSDHAVTWRLFHGILFFGEAVLPSRPRRQTIQETCVCPSVVCKVWCHVR
jgi:hypothetical protein